MARSKNVGRSKNPPKTAPTSASSSKEKSKPTVPALLAKAQSLMGEMDFELARKFVDRILEVEPNHFEAREMAGVMEAEEGNVDSARSIFISLVPPSPTARTPASHSAYLYLAQLTSDPREALSHYQAAVDILLGLIKGKERALPQQNDPADPDPESEAGLKRTAISAIVAMVEIWMTSDLCMEPEAEQTCDSLISMALSADPNNVEALDSLASVRLSQSRGEEAKQVVEKAWEITQSLEPDDPRYPPISSQLSLARRFLELSLFSQALLLLQNILGMDDEEVDAWYLQGWCFFLMAQKVKETGEKIEDLGWSELAQDARDCLEACKNFYTQGEHDDEELIGHVQELIQQLEEGGIKPSLEIEGDMDDGEGLEEDWEDEEESDVEMG
ncbi:TPR-like protein [Clavulina sp. PMI_390]|nr:TPR-like protein [Clavulina sp. PMI_390]